MNKITVPSGHAIIPVEQVVRMLNKADKHGYNRGVVAGVTVTVVSLATYRLLKKGMIRELNNNTFVSFDRRQEPRA